MRRYGLALCFVLASACALGDFGPGPGPGVGFQGSSGGAPAAVTEAYLNQGGTGCPNANQGVGCLTNVADLYWTASPGATDYPIIRNGTQIADPNASTACATNPCHYTDNTATNLNCTSGNTTAAYCLETVYQYGIQAHNGSGTSVSVNPGNYTYFNGAGPATGNSCGNFSGGGFGNFNSGTDVVASFTAGSNVVTVTAVSGGYAGTLYPFQGFTDQKGAITNSIATGGPGNPYILPYGSGGTTGTGGTGTYLMSTNAASTQTADGLWASPAPNVGGGKGAEACPQTQTVESPHTFALANYSRGSNFMQQYVGAPESPGYDANWSGYSCWGMDVYTTTSTQSLFASIHTRPGTHASNTGDIYSTRYVQIVNGTSSAYVAGGTLTLNAWNHLCIPLPQLGIGTGTWSGYVTSTWHGTATLNGSGGLTIVSTTDGNANNIAVNEYIAYHTSSGWGCTKITGVTTPGTTYTVVACPQGGIGPQTNVEMYDANAYVQSITSGVGPDNGGNITGQGEPVAFFGGAVIGFAGTPNPTGVGQFVLFAGNSAAIVAAGTGSGGVCTSGCVTFGSSRISVYKPEVFFKDASGFQPTYFDRMGGTAN